MLWLAACTEYVVPVPTRQSSYPLGGPALPTYPPVPILDSGTTALGQEVYRLHCAVCHGLNLEGAPEWKTPNEDGSFRAPPHDERGHTWHHSDQELIERIKFGTTSLPDEFASLSNMPAFEGLLSDNEILSVLAYIQSTWPAEIRQDQWQTTLITDGNK